MIGPEIAALVARGHVTLAEVRELRCNSWEWEALVPAMTTEALVHMTEHAIANSNRARRPCTTYDEAVIHCYAPELLKRLRCVKHEDCAKHVEIGVECAQGAA